MAIEMVPYSNFHDLNLDWVLQVVKTASDRLDTMDESIADAAESAEAAAASAADADSAAQSAAAQAVTAAGHANAAATYAENAASSYNDTHDLYQDISGTVGQAATDWLEDHITQETGYVIDDTLTVQGAAADAKAAGDRLTAVEGQAAGTALGLSIIQMDMAVVKGNFADEYSNDTSVLYAVGDYCVRNNLFFRCVTATTGGNWDSSAWEMTNVGAEIQNVQDDAAAAVAAATAAQQSAAQASGAATSAANAASTAANAATTAANSASTAASAATNAANSASAATTAAANAASAASTATAAAAEAAASAESINIDTITEMIYNAYPHDTASGAIASFPDGANSIPVIDLLVSLEPIQSGSGTPAPDNVRPISGHTACEVWRTGANIWDEEWENGYLGIDGTNVSYIASSSRIRSKNWISVVVGQTYYYNGGGYGSFIVGADDTNGTNAVQITSTDSTGFTFTATRPFIKFAPHAGYGGSYNGNISVNYPSTDTEYHAHSIVNIEIPLGQTVYGGTLDVTSGALTVNRAMVDMGSLNWVYQSSSQRMQTGDLTNIKYAESNFNAGNLMCSMYANGPASSSSHLPESVAVGASYSVGVVVYDDSYTDAATFKTAVTGQQLVYELASPIEIQLTAHELNTLLGQNNVWSDSGNVSVEYRADITKYIEKVIN